MKLFCAAIKDLADSLTDEQFEYMECIVEELNEVGIKNENLTVLCAILSEARINRGTFVKL